MIMCAEFASAAMSHSTAILTVHLRDAMVACLLLFVSLQLGSQQLDSDDDEQDWEADSARAFEVSGLGNFRCLPYS
jgi:hypothetical protein